MAKPRGPKLRTYIVSGVGPSMVPSHARPHKPPAKKEPLPLRVRPTDPRDKDAGPTRYGKREPKAGGHDHAAETRDARPSRRADTPAPDPGTRRDKEARLAPRQ